MRLSRRIVILTLFLTVAAGVWAAIYVQNRGFYESWRTRIENEFAKREIYIGIDRVTLGPFQGLVAEKVYFYQDPEKKREIAFIDNMILDLDLTEVLNKDLTINSIDVQDSPLSLPLTPGKRDSEMLMIDHFSGRLVMTENQIEIVKAEGELQGVEIALKGSLHRSPEDPGKGKGDAAIDRDAQRRELRELGRRIEQLQTVLRELKYFDFDPKKPPRLEINFSGDLDNLQSLRGSARLAAENFSRDSYAVEMLTASLDFDGVEGRATLKELHLRDPKGDLRLWAEWQTDGDEAHFDLETTADLQLLARTLFPDPRLREVNFFDPPRLKMEGKLDLEKLRNFEFTDLPVEAIGEFRSSRIGSRGGLVFDGLEFDFSTDGSRYYIRNLRLDHISGTMLANLMFDPTLEEETFRFQSEIKFDPRTVSPFLRNNELQRFLNRWSFGRESTIYVAAIGSGPNFDPYRWNSQGVIELRNFRLNNVPFDQLETEYETLGRRQVFQNVKLVRPEGELNVSRAVHHSDTNRWELFEADWKLDLEEGARAFYPSLAGELAPFRFGRNPEIKGSGTIDSRSAGELGDEKRKHDFQLSFESDGPAEYEILDRTVSLDNPRGVLRVDSAGLHLTEFGADVFGGELSAEYRANDGEDRNGFVARLALENASLESFGTLFGDAEGAGGELSGKLEISGRRGGDPEALNGFGSVTGNRVDLFAIPLFAPLAELTPELKPGNRVTDAAAADFKLANGVLSTDDLTARATGFQFSGAGEIDLTNGEFHFDSSLEFPGSRLRLFSGEGKTGDPRWKRVKVKRPVTAGSSGGVSAENPGE